MHLCTQTCVLTFCGMFPASCTVLLNLVLPMLRCTKPVGLSLAVCGVRCLLEYQTAVHLCTQTCVLTFCGMFPASLLSY